MPDITEIAVSTPSENPSVGTSGTQSADNQIAPSENVGVTEDTANKTEVVSQENKTEIEKQTMIPINLYENRIQEVRRLQSERDKAEAYARSLIEKAMPYVNIDDNGNILGPRVQQPQQPAVDIEMITARAAAGDTDAIRQMNEMIIHQAKQEALNEFKAMQSQENIKNQITNEIKSEFPDLFLDNGVPNNDNPIWTEANNIVSNERKGWYDMNNPYHVKSVLEIARSRVILNAYPQLKNAVKKEVTAEIKKTGAMTTAGVSPTQTQNDEKLALSQEQIDHLKRTGKGDSESLSRISNMVKQVKNRSFVIS